jgi:hypothetical protein
MIARLNPAPRDEALGAVQITGDAGQNAITTCDGSVSKEEMIIVILPVQRHSD